MLIALQNVFIDWEELVGITYDKNNTKIDKIKSAVDIFLFIKKKILDNIIISITINLKYLYLW